MFSFGSFDSLPAQKKEDGLPGHSVFFPQTLERNSAFRQILYQLPLNIFQLAYSSHEFYAQRLVEVADEGD